MDCGKKILMLSMSCNQPHFQALLGAVKNTWAKPIIEGKYPNITWFGYTSCDERHPRPMVDLEDHMIYVDRGDELRDTFYKTRDAYNMVKDLVDFDYIVRTNTSVYINIDIMIERLSYVENDTVCTNFIYEYDEKTGITNYIITGYYMSMSKKIWEFGMDGDVIKYENDHNKYPNNDDVVISKNIVKNCGEYASYSVNESRMIPMYKSYPETYGKLESYLTNSNFDFCNNPNIVNQNVLVRIRSLYEINRYENQEVQHMYELHNTKNNGLN